MAREWRKAGGGATDAADAIVAATRAMARVPAQRGEHAMPVVSSEECLMGEAT